MLQRNSNICTRPCFPCVCMYAHLWGCVYACVCTIAIVCWFFNVEFLQVRLSLVDETLFSLYLLESHIENIPVTQAPSSWKTKKQGRRCPKTCRVSTTCHEPTVGIKWIQNTSQQSREHELCSSAECQTEPSLTLTDPPAAHAEPARHYQMTLEMLVSLGSSGSMALLACASSRLCSRLFPGGLCPFSSVSGMLQ